MAVTVRTTNRSTRSVEDMTLDEAIAERQRLIRETMDAQDVLSDRNRLDPDGKRVSAHAYWEWHRGVSKQVRDNQHRMGLLRERIRQLRQVSTSRTAKVQDSTDLGLLTSAYNLLKTLVNEGVDLDPDEQALLDTIRERVQGTLTTAANGSRK